MDTDSPATGRRAWWPLVAAALSLMLALPTPRVASAGPNYRAYPASACLSGDAGPYDLVWQGDRNGSAPFLQLSCGVPDGWGVLHIAEDHPIAEDGTDDTDLRRCASNVLRLGEDEPAATRNLALKMTRRDGGSATIVWEQASGRVISLFTSDSNNWRACAEFVAGS